MKRKILLFLLLICPLCLHACEQKETIVLEPLPTMTWHDMPVTLFLTKDAWRGQKMDWAMITTALRNDVVLPDALETRLLREDREIWKNVIAAVESYELNRRNALVASNLQIPPAVSCEPPSTAFTLDQRAQLHRMLQLHRNVLWRLGRLEMATRQIKNALEQFLPQYDGGRIKDADVAVVGPVKTMMAQIHTIRANYAVPNGIWSPGELHFRMARLAPLAPIMMQTSLAFEQWNRDIATSPRWQYLTGTGDATHEALKSWIKEFESVMMAYRYLTASIQNVEQSFAGKNKLVAFPCINQNLRRLRVVADLFGSILPMQWALTKAENEALRVKERLSSPDYEAINHDYLISEVDRSYESFVSQISRLSRTSDLMLMLWDETTYKIWGGLPEFLDPIHYRSKPAVESAETWRAMYQAVKAEIKTLTVKLQPEPEQPLDRRGRPYSQPIQKILDDLRSPSRIDEVEHGLLAISELEAHLVSIRDELMRLCRDGACRSFPEAELAYSPRKSPWIVSWRQSPVAERTLGHSLIVLKLCQLHLSRLVQRLTEIYAWFAETSNADNTWKTLKNWQRIWTLYSEPNGTYSNFLRSVSALSSEINDMARPDTKRLQSQTLSELLNLQSDLFDLTIDYARFIDERAQPPVPFDEMMSTWESVQTAIETIAILTQERDQKLAPETEKKPSRVKKDYDR